MSRWHDLDRVLEQAPGDWGACVQLLDGRTVYSYAPDRVRPAASLIKVPLAMALVEASLAAENGKAALDLEAVVVLREQDRVDGDGSFDSAPVGTTRTLHELIGHMLRESDNTAGNLLMAIIGKQAVNDYLRAEPLALEKTCLRRSFMDFAAAARGDENLTTAREMCAIFQTLHRYQSRFAVILHWLTCSTNNERLVSGLPAGIVVAHKDGDLDGVEHDAGIVYAPREPYIVTLLSEDLPRAKSGDRTIAEVSRLIFQHMAG